MPNSFKKYRSQHKRYFLQVLLGLLMTIPIGSWGQHPIQYTAAFTSLLEEHHLSFDLPEDAWYKVTTRHADQLAEYDLILESHKEKMEIRYRWQPAPGWSDEAFKMQFISLLSTLATNDDEAFMAFNQLGSYLSQERYHATKAMIARFQPKQAISPFSYARLLQLYHPEQGIITCMVLYKDKNNGELAQKRLQHLRFE